MVGLTGGIGSGKTTVANQFASYGIDLVDTDIISREVVQSGKPALNEIAAHFGSELINADGMLEREKLRKIIFADEAEKKWLESLLHPLIAELLISKIESTTSPYCMLVSPLLLETSQRDLADRILVVDVSEATQIQRTLERDDSDENTIRAIIASQIDRQSRLQAADDILENEADVTTLKLSITKLHEQYLNLVSQ